MLTIDLGTQFPTDCGLILSEGYRKSKEFRIDTPAWQLCADMIKYIRHGRPWEWYPIIVCRTDPGYQELIELLATDTREQEIT